MSRDARRASAACLRRTRVALGRPAPAGRAARRSSERGARARGHARRPHGRRPGLRHRPPRGPSPPADRRRPDRRRSTARRRWSRGARAKHGSDRVEWLCRDVLDTGLASTRTVDVVLCYNTWPHFDDRRCGRARARPLAPAARARARLARHRARASRDDPRRRPRPHRRDRLPPVAELAALFSAAGLAVERADEDDGSYTLLARRPPGG